MQLQGKTDEGLVKNAFKLFRDHLGLRVVLTPGQFLEQVRAATEISSSSSVSAALQWVQVLAVHARAPAATAVSSALAAANQQQHDNRLLYNSDSPWSSVTVCQGGAGSIGTQSTVLAWRSLLNSFGTQLMVVT